VVIDWPGKVGMGGGCCKKERKIHNLRWRLYKMGGRLRLWYILLGGVYIAPAWFDPI
jgi:hypothetical protein